MENFDLKHYKVVILAGGKGTRLYPVTLETPKPLLPIARKPMINHVIDLFASQGAKEAAVLVNTDFRADFDWWKKRYYPASNVKIFEEKTSLGTFGGLGLLSNWLKNKPFFLANADDLMTLNLKEMASFHHHQKTVATVALARVANPKGYGVAVCNGDLIKDFVEKPEKPASEYINSGLYLLNPAVFDYHKGLVSSMIEKDLFPVLAKTGKLAGFKFSGKWIDCGTWERYELAQKEWT